MIDAEDIEIFSKQTGSLYDEHVRLAKNGAGIERWVIHVRTVVVPLYIQTTLKPTRTTTTSMIANGDDIRLAAKNLRTYYLDHIKEL